MKQQKPDNKTPEPVRKWTVQSLAVHLDLPKSTVGEILIRAGQHGPVKLEDATKAILAHYKAASEAKTSEAQADEDRKRKAEADTAVMKANKEAERLVDLDWFKRAIRTLAIGWREQIRRMPGLTMDQKVAVCDIIAKTELPEEE